MKTVKALDGKPYAGNPHVRFDEGAAASAATPRRWPLLCKKRIVVAAAMLFCTMCANAATYYASPNGTGTGNTADDPCSLATGIDRAKFHSDTLILKSGRYLLNGAIALTGADIGNDPTIVRGETDDPKDVILDAQGTSEVMRLNRNVIVSGITMMNGSNKGFASDKYGNRAAGVRVSYTPDDSSKNTSCVVSNCVVTCCTNEFTSSTKINNNEVCGGAVAVFENGLLVDSVVTNNTAVYRGGGVVILNKGVVRNCLIAENSAENDGGGLLVERNAIGALVADSTISSNRVGESGNGGGVVSRIADTSFTLTNCTIRGNSANVGGGMYLAESTSAKCLDCRFEQNSASQMGGGTRIYGSARGLFRDCTFDGNTATSDGEDAGGGACFVNNQVSGGIASFTNCVFCNNTSASRGGAYLGWHTFTRAEFVDCIITNNSCKRQGGGVCVRDDRYNSTLSILLRNCLVAHNRTTSTTSDEDASGAGVYLVATNAVIDCCTIVSNAVANTGKSYGGGLYHRWGGSVTNTIIAFNLKGNSLETGSYWCLGGDEDSPVSSAYRNCCVWPAADSAFLEANGCKNADPRFNDAANGDFTLSRGSPCKNAGILEDWMTGAFDLAGNPRVYFDIPDIGCYELVYRSGLWIIIR